jgi:hypothetical protein
MVKCEECRHIYRDDKLKCPRCGLERDIFDPAERQKGPGAQFRDGGGLMGWAEVYKPDRPEAAFERQLRLLQQVAGGPPGMNAAPRQPVASMWRRGGYR